MKESLLPLVSAMDDNKGFKIATSKKDNANVYEYNTVFLIVKPRKSTAWSLPPVTPKKYEGNTAVEIVNE